MTCTYPAYDNGWKVIAYPDGTLIDAKGQTCNYLYWEGETAARLKVNPAPDTQIRVFMAWQGTDVYAELPEQELTALERKGFTVIEWGGTEIK